MSRKAVTVAVLPFQNLSPEPETEYFANGFSEDLTVSLTRFPSLRVIAAQSAFGLGPLGKPLDEAAREWGLQFVLKGSVRWGEGQIRLSLALLRLPEQEIVWAEQIDAPQEQVFSVQDQIVGTVAGRLAIQVDEVKLRAARSRSPEDLQAYDCWLRGMDCLKRGTLEGDQEAREFFQQAMRIDPAYPRAYSGLSLSHFNEWSCQAWHLWEESGPSAFDYASKAVELDDTDAMAHSVLGRVCRFRHQHRQADHHAARALALNPSDAHVLIQVAVTKLFGGQFEECRQLALKAADLNPLHGPWYEGIIGWSLFMMRRYAEARQFLSTAGEAIVELPAYRAACAVAAGKPEQARLEYESFLQEYRNKIAFGRQPDPEEPLSWAVQVEPFRSLEASRLMPDILRDGGIAEIDVERVLKSRSHLSVRPAEITQPEGNAFVRDGQLWSLSYLGKGAQLVEVKGFHDIARLLSQPGESVHCLELSGAAPSADTPQDVLDTRARREYRRRMEELQREIDLAEDDHDPARSEPARRELDLLIDELSKATGLRGRRRKMTDSGERARSAVTWRIRSAIKKISAAHPRLGQHLSNSIRTGHFCLYSPESKTAWKL